jgi:hypothetical protein
VGYVDVLDCSHYELSVQDFAQEQEEGLLLYGVCRRCKPKGFDGRACAPIPKRQSETLTISYTRLLSQVIRVPTRREVPKTNMPQDH